MKAFKRAWLYITRRKTKTVLLMITFFLIGNLVILGMGISQAADNAKIMTRKSMNPVVSYEVDFNAFDKYVNEIEDENEQEEAWKKFPQLSLETVEEIAKDERVKTFNATVKNVAYSKGFENVPLGNEDKKNEHMVGMTESLDGDEEPYVEPNISLIGNFYPDMIEFENGTFNLVDGRLYSQDEIDQGKRVCVITKALADFNGLHVGDDIQFNDPSAKWILQNFKEHGIEDFTEDDFIKEYEIIGIYETERDVNPTDEHFEWMSPFESPKNVILVPSSSMNMEDEAIREKQFEISVMEGWSEESDRDDFLKGYEQLPEAVVYLLNDPLEVDQFVEDYTPKLQEFTKLNANNEMFKKMSRPLDTLSFFANIIVWIVIVNAVVIISLVTALTLKTRQYEMGVLLSIGVSKVKVVAQLFYELILIAIVGFALASVSGSMIAGSVGEKVLNYQTEVDAQYNADDEFDNDMHWDWNGTSDYFTEVSQDDLLAQYHVSISPALIGEIFAIGAIVVLLAIIVPSFMIMRLNPKQILLEQN